MKLKLQWGLIAAAFFVGGVLPIQAKEAVKIGVVLPLSSSSVGATAESAKNALLLAHSKIPANSRFDYELYIEDDGFEPRRSVLACQQLLSVKRVDVLMTLWEPGSKAALPSLQKNGALHISPTRWMKAPAYDKDFVLSGSAESYARKAVELLKGLGVKRLAILVTQDNANKYCLSFLLPMLKDAGIAVVDKYECNLDVKDFRPWIARLKTKQVDAVLQNAYMPTTELALKQMKELDFKPLQAGLGNFFTEVSADLAEGTCYILQYPERQDFLNAYLEAYGQAPRYPAANYFDALGIVISAAEGLPVEQKPTAVNIAEALRKVQAFNGALGVTKFTSPNKLECELTYYYFTQGKPKPVTLEELIQVYHKK